MAALTVIQMRRGAASLWAANDPILSAGEPGYETDTGNFKLGDGILPWTSLPYVGADKALVGHTHTSTQITDSTATGRAVLTAASTSAARAAIGAGTSDLVIGSTGTTAKAGNWVPSFSEVTGLIGTNQLPPLAINQPTPVASQAAMLALVAQRGDVAIRTDVGKTFILATDNPGTLADWLELIGTSDVVSVAGKTGAVTLAKADVGLGNVDNTADSAKPISTVQATEFATKADLASPTFTGTVGGITKAMVGLSAVDNTSDTAKPVSTAQATALAGKEANIAAGTTAQYWRGDKTWQTNDKASVGLANVDNTSDLNKPVSTATNTQLALKAPLASPTFTGTVSGVTKAHVGLSAVDNTADTAKPVSTAQQTALNLKANLASPTFTGTVGGITKAMVGLTNVDNTADSAKPVSTAQQTALNGKANTAHSHVSADITTIDGGTP